MIQKLGNELGRSYEPCSLLLSHLTSGARCDTSCFQSSCDTLGGPYDELRLHAWKITRVNFSDLINGVGIIRSNP